MIFDFFAKTKTKEVIYEDSTGGECGEYRISLSENIKAIEIIYADNRNDTELIDGGIQYYSSTGKIPLNRDGEDAYTSIKLRSVINTDSTRIIWHVTAGLISTGEIYIGHCYTGEEITDTQCVPVKIIGYYEE